MNLADSPLVKPHLGHPAILDSNLLLFSWCVNFDSTLLSRFKRLNSFQEEDISLLLEISGLFPVLRTTTHVLTEVSNLANALPRHVKDDWSEYFSEHIEVISEEWVPASRVATSPLMWLGLTDAALASLAQFHVVLTLDFPLSNSLSSRGLNVINFTHLRDF